MRDAFGVEATLIGGGGGVYDVVVDGEVLWSKHREGDFPDDDALVEVIRQRR